MHRREAEGLADLGLGPGGDVAPGPVLDRLEKDGGS